MLDKRLVHLPVVAFAAIVVAGGPAHAQFGKGLLQQKTKVSLTRRVPPKVYLMGTAIMVTASAQRPELGTRLAALLEAELLAADSRLRPERTAPETRIECSVTAFEVKDDEWFTRKVTRSRQVGEESVWNEKKKQYEKKPKYANVEENVRYQVVAGTLTMTYRAVDDKGVALDSDTVSVPYRQEFAEGVNAPSKGALEDHLLQRAVGQVVPRLAPTRETLEVLLARPTDAIDKINDFAKAGLWSTMLERLSLMAPLKEAKKEAYRQFNLGVANEGMAYASDDLATAQRLLSAASDHYMKAMEMKPDEEYFRSPLGRIKTGLAAYRQIESQQAEYSRSLAAAKAAGERALAAPAGAVSPTETPAKHDKVFDNAAVIALLAEGLDVPNLLSAIKAEKTVKFDLSVDGLLQLRKAKVPNPVIAAMREKAASKSSRPAPAKPPAAPKKGSGGR